MLNGATAEYAKVICRIKQAFYQYCLLFLYIVKSVKKRNQYKFRRTKPCSTFKPD